MKNIVKIVIIVAAFVVALAFGKDLLAKAAVEGGVKAVTGLKLSMRSFHLGLLSSKVKITDLQLHNPKGFGKKTMVELPEILVDMDLQPIFKGKIHVEDVVIHLKQFEVIKNKDGALNLDALTALQPEAKKEAPVKEKAKAKAMDLQIDRVALRIDSVFYEDHSVPGGKPLTKEFKININEEYKNITDPNALVQMIVFKALRNTTIGSLANIDVKGLMSESAQQALASGKELTDATLAKTAEALDSMKTAVDLEKTGQMAGEMASKTSDAMMDSAGSLKEKTGSLFGSLKEKVTT